MQTSNAVLTAQCDAAPDSCEFSDNDADYGAAVVLDFDPAASFRRDEEILEHQVADMQGDPNKPRKGHGPTIYIGFDSEFVSGKEVIIEEPSIDTGKNKLKRKKTRIRHDNRVLSLQFYLIGENHGTFTRVINLRGGNKANRPCFNKVIVRLINDAMESGAVLEWPEQVVLCGFFLRIDLPAFGDFNRFKHDLQNVGGKVYGWCEVKESEEVPEIEHSDADNEGEQLVFLQSRTVIASDRDGVLRTLKVRFVDVSSHVEMGTSLAQIGDTLGLAKLSLPEGYSKDAMDVLQRERPAEFEAYGLRDSEIAVRFYLHLQSFARSVLSPGKEVGGKKFLRHLPTTASSLAVKMFIEQMSVPDEDVAQSRERINKAFGVMDVSTPYCDSESGLMRTYKDTLPIPMRAIHEPFVASCYNGGRNECYAFGPTAIGEYNDFDLAGAYTTGLVDLRYIDFESPRVSTEASDFVGHVLGFAYVEFEFPENTRFPCLPVRTRSNSLIYPLTGTSYCTAPEIEVALNLGCSIKIMHGVIFPWLAGDARLFEPFVSKIRELRDGYKKGTTGERYVKLLGNSLYGKTAQGLRDRTVFDAKQLKNTALSKSPITNAAIAAHATGFIRAVLSELIASVPVHRQVVSATTDGFLTNADLSELKLDGAMANRFKSLCERVAPGKPMLECKHKVRQLIAMKTRGQLTTIPLEESEIVLAKAGVSPDINVVKYEDKSKEEVARIQNQYMLDLFLGRKPDAETESRPFVSFRDQWTKDGDVIRLTRTKRLNLEFDMKRRLVNPRLIAANQIEHIALDSVPWHNIDECERARSVFNGWRRQNCLKTLADYDNWDEFYQFSIVRDRLKAEGVSAAQLRVTRKGVIDVFRRMFLRAYSQGLCGLRNTMTYGELSAWLTGHGYPTTTDEVKNAKRAKFIEHAIPATLRVLELAKVLEEGFPSIEINKFIESKGAAA